MRRTINVLFEIERFMYESFKKKEKTGDGDTNRALAFAAIFS
jgi:hypothetical protein